MIHNQSGKEIAESNEYDQHLMKGYRVYYNSGFKYPRENYSVLIKKKLLQGTVTVSENGAMIFKDQSVWNRNEKRKLIKNQFVLKQRRFIGWKLQAFLNGDLVWYCVDSCFHSCEEINSIVWTEPYLFRDEEEISLMTVQDGSIFMMIAVWV